MNWLVVGLGNPGSRYEKNRHNLGFMTVDELAKRLAARVDRQECEALVGRGRIGETIVELAKPQTYMNLSGNSVACLVGKETRSIERLLVISDDLALPLGALRIRQKGSHGGQNGLRSIIDRLGTSDFCRLRLGMAPEHPIGDTSRFVLSDFAKDEAKTVESMIETAADAAEAIIRDGVEAAMARFN